MAARNLRRLRRLWSGVRLGGLGFIWLWLRGAGSIPGWLNFDDAALLYRFARSGPGRGAIVEIGSAWGRSTTFLAAGSKRARSAKVYAVDPHTGVPEFLERRRQRATHPGELKRLGFDDTGGFSSLAGFEATIGRFGLKDRVEPVVMMSTEAAGRIDTGPVRLLFIDGMHTYEGVRQDIECWLPRVVPGGVLVFDDYFNPAYPGVARAVDELLSTRAIEPGLRQAHGDLVWMVKR